MKKILFILLTFNSITFMQQSVKFNAEFRPRFEIDNKDFNSNNQSTTFTFLRSRLSAKFNSSNNISAYFEIQDSRVFGEETSTTANLKNVDLHQAYIKLDNIFSLPIDFKVGRFELIYNNQRLIGNSNWGNTGRSFDGALLTLNTQKFKMDFFAIKEFEKFNIGDTSDQNMFGAFFDLKLFSNYQIQPIFIWQNLIPSTNFNSFTIGTYIKGNLGNLSHEEEIYYQVGKMKSSKEYDISAYMLAGNVSYSFNLPSKPFVGIGIDYLSGDNVVDNQYRVFNTVYGTAHKFYGFMDYFVNIPNDTYNLGLSDLYFKASLNILSEIKASFYLHFFNSAKDYKLKNGILTKSFGNEVDLLLNYNYSKEVVIESGLSFFSPGDIFQEKKGKDTSTWFYLMIVANL